ncbi:MAG: ComF family protein [Patescibacteria group bacterium]
MNLNFILDLLFPPRCLNCGVGTRPKEVVCASCLNAVPKERTLFCGVCRARLPQARKICHPRSAYILGTAANYSQPVVKNLIHALKFKGTQDAAIPLAKLLIDYTNRAVALTGRETVVPIPLGPRRLRQRGYNQAGAIGKIFAAHFRLKYAPEILRRARHTRPQSDLHSLMERETNVADCFELAAPLPPKSRLLLIDDVVTSGSTFRAAAETLHRGGVRNVLALAVARA